jgi:RNA polymerase sigma-70 factor, ECF subfamily
MVTTSVSLLERLAASGDDEDWRKLLQIYRPFIEKVVQSYPLLASQSDDITQEVVLVLMRELPVFRRERVGSFRTWLRNITVNQLRTALRKLKRQSLAATDWTSIKDQVEALADPLSLASQRWDEEHDCAVMQRVIDIVRPSVQPQTWAAFERYAIQDQDPSQVAKELGLSLNSVLLAKSRVLRRLRAEAKGLVDE